MLGTVVFFNPERHFGRIRTEDGSALYFVHVSDLLEPDTTLLPADLVEFDVEQHEKGLKAVRVRRVNQVDALSPSKNCFVVMPYGRTPEEIRWFAGWYRLVIEDGVRAAGFQPILSAIQQRPNAINDEIRAHLALDPMVVVDLGGATPTDDPNPNVMYELGIRHAFNLPHVIMAWEGQRLPFDISNQRVIMERRDLIDVPTNKDRLTKFIKEAAAGSHYRPMDAVGRAATLGLAERRLGPDSVLGALVEEVRDLKSRFSLSKVRQRGLVPVKTALGTKEQRRHIKVAFIKAGGTEYQWSRVLTQKVDTETAQTLRMDNSKPGLLLALASKLVPPKAKPKPPDTSPTIAEAFETVEAGESVQGTTSTQRGPEPSDASADTRERSHQETLLPGDS